ncbi:glycoside hydrolase family 3 C-terminal domain-containing protein [Caproicibacterium sp. XB1]|uniref:glycoside hydrolase family 3 C-terminal domain-containing protein n=1 Tax=Caproicibacterium sp. XB1 TaxID=3396405 RepID=UPI0039B6F21D
MEISEILSKLTLEEKARLCTGADAWHTACPQSISVPQVTVSDGPHGLRRETGVPGESASATCFPSGSALGASWDPNLLEELGEALGEECRAQGVDVLLGPAVNIKRSPLCGRNFEYYAEDPCLAGTLAAAYIRGVQKQGVGTSLKHFAANNKETGRLTTDTAVDARTLRELYLPAFETAVKEAQPWTVMAAYNRLNGTYCAENKRLLTDLLRGEWGFQGLVMSDWGAVSDRDRGIAAGLDLEMPGGCAIGPQKIIRAVQNGTLSEEALDRCVTRVLELAQKAAAHKKPAPAKTPEALYAQHHALARKIAEHCMVLLKNDGTLPLRKTGSLAVIGEFAKTPRCQGGGSSHIHPTALDVPLEEIRKAAPQLTVSYSEGYTLTDDRPDEVRIAAAVQTAAAADAAVIFAGLPDAYESEGFDRSHMRIPESHNALIQAVAHAQKNTVVVLSNGSPVEMPWTEQVSAILESYLCGQATGSAQAAILFGSANPCGKLAETFPRKLQDNPSYLNFPITSPDFVAYRESVFVGYRYYDTKQVPVCFPFGHGLSYTTFSYLSIETDRAELTDRETLTVRVTLKNTGSRAGRETVQLYVHDMESSIPRPEKELRAFRSVELQPGEEATVSFPLSKRAFAYYDAAAQDWTVEDGVFQILAGGSSAETPLCASVTVHPAEPRPHIFTRHTLTAEAWDKPATRAVLKEFLTKAGCDNLHVQADWMRDMPLRNLFMFGAVYTQEELDQLVETLNRTTTFC